MRQGLGPYFALLSKYLGDQWSIGDWAGFLAAGAVADLAPMVQVRTRALAAAGAEPPQNFKEYDPEWGRACATGTISAGCDHGRMLRQVRCPVLLTHHSWEIDEATGNLNGALAGQQARRVQELITAAGQPITYRTFPTMPHSMHRTDPALYARTLLEWASRLPSEDEVRQQGVFAR
jgi:pimeloyl-ACP methyl ester carboxylesterase